MICRNKNLFTHEIPFSDVILYGGPSGSEVSRLASLVFSSTAVLFIDKEKDMAGSYVKKTDGTGRIVLKERQKAEIFALINTGGTKQQVYKRYLSMTKTSMKEGSYQKLKQAAKKAVGKAPKDTRSYTLPPKQVLFERKAAEVLSCYAEQGDWKRSTIKSILISVQDDFDSDEVKKLKFSRIYITRFLNRHFLIRKRVLIRKISE